MSKPRIASGSARSRLGWLLRQIEHFLAASGAVLLAYFLTMDVSVITSESMAPTLKGTSRENGDWVLTERVSYKFREPKRWEIVTFRNTEGTQVIKRVVGLPGEVVSMESRRILINGKPVPMPANVAAIKYLPFGNLFKGQAVSCDEGYYVLGDDSADSQDSRFEGPVSRDRIIGRAWMILRPWSRRARLTPGRMVAESGTR